MGRPAGVAPSRILATKVAALRYMSFCVGPKVMGKPSRAKLGVRPIAGKRLDNAALATNGRFLRVMMLDEDSTTWWAASLRRHPFRQRLPATIN